MGKNEITQEEKNKVQENQPLYFSLNNHTKEGGTLLKWSHKEGVELF
jgi:hypothetical protein